MAKNGKNDQKYLVDQMLIKSLFFNRFQKILDLKLSTGKELSNGRNLILLALVV